MINMKDGLTLAFMSILVAGVGGCANDYVDYGQRMEELKGISESDLVGSWGQPAEVLEVDEDTKIFTYLRVLDIVVMRPPRPVCRTDFEITDGVAVSIRYSKECR